MTSVAAHRQGIISKTDIDLLGRTTRTVDGHTTNGSSIASIDQTTDYTYDGDNHVLRMTAETPNSTPTSQVTQYGYGNAAASLVAASMQASEAHA